MTPEDAEEYTQSLGQIFAGSWRQILWADQQGIPEALGLSTRDWVEQRLGGYVRLSIPERRAAIAELPPEMPNTEAAEILGVHEATIRRDRASSNDEDIEPERIQQSPLDSSNDDSRQSDLEEVISEQEHRIEVWADKIRDALRVEARMVGYPVPSELQAKLNVSELAALMTILDALEGKIDAGFLEELRTAN